MSIEFNYSIEIYTLKNNQLLVAVIDEEEQDDVVYRCEIYDLSSLLKLYKDENKEKTIGDFLEDSLIDLYYISVEKEDIESVINNKLETYICGFDSSYYECGIIFAINKIRNNKMRDNNLRKLQTDNV